MRRIKRKNHNQRKSVGKVLTGALLGSAIGAAVGWLTAPASGRETRRRIRDAGMRSLASRRKDSREAVQDRIKTAEGNVESRVRQLEETVNEDIGGVKKTVTRRRKTAAG